MTLPILAVMLLLTAISAWFGWRRCAAGLAILGLLLLLLIGCGPLPIVLLHDLQRPYASRIDQNWAPRNAIVLLGAGTSRLDSGAQLEPYLGAYGRISRTVMLYRQCKASGQQCLVLVSGGDPQHHGTSEAVVYADTLRRLGIAPTDMMLETRSMNTWQNARLSRPLLLAWHPQQLLLVDSAIHLRRSMRYFDRFGMRPTAVSGDVVSASLTWRPASGNMQLFDAALHEYLGLLQLHLYNFTGLNAQPVTAPLIPSPPA